MTEYIKVRKEKRQMPNDRQTPDNRMKIIRYLTGGGFVDQQVQATNVRELRAELDIDARASVSVGGQNATDDTPISEGDTVAAVSNNKTGG